jgi:DegT/DnrJ/EryC1/StrS aminotransferase family
MHTIRLERPPERRDVQSALLAGFMRRVPETKGEPGFRFLGSGKAAIAAVLGFLRRTGILASKNSEVLVPQWLGIPVYQQVTNYAFPVLSCTARTRAVLVYHQYGFPQDMDRILDFAGTNKLTVIEDCAHAADSFYKNQRLGTLGEYAIYSFSKFTFCFALGGVSFREADFSGYLDSAIKRQPRLLRSAINLFKLIDEFNLSDDRPRLPSLMTRGRIAAYSLYGESLAPSKRAIALWAGNGPEELATRRRYFAHLRDRTRDLGICDHLETVGVAPYAIPVRMPDAKARLLVARLDEEGIHTGIYRFDMNRCFLEPNFAPCVLLPCHGGISGAEFDKIVEIVRHASQNAV